MGRQDGRGARSATVGVLRSRIVPQGLPVGVNVQIDLGLHLDASYLGLGAMAIGGVPAAEGGLLWGIWECGAEPAFYLIRSMSRATRDELRRRMTLLF